MQLLFFIALGIAAFLIVNSLGGKHIQCSYQNDLFDDEFGKNTVFNIAFRVIAPIVTLTFFGLICALAGFKFDFLCLMISGEAYWTLRILMWIMKHRTVRSSIAMVLAQAAVSLSLCWYLFAAIGEAPLKSLTPDVGDVSLEFIVLAITVLFYVLAESPLFRRDRSSKSHLMEKQLFAIDKLCRNSLPERYRQDIALLILLYTFALIEDTYRPSWIRRAERIAHRILPLKKPRTFGLMQAASDYPLSDEESIVSAYATVSDIYETFIETNQELAIDPMDEDGQVPCIVFFQGGYIYELSDMLSTLETQAASLYGKYCGTYLLDVYNYFDATETFVLSQYNISRLQSIQVSHNTAKPWAALQANGWYPLSRQKGFACQGGEDAARVLASSRPLSEEQLVSQLKELNLESCIYLAYWGVDGTVIVLSEDSGEDQISELAQKFNLSAEITSYHFEDFISNPRGFLDRVPNVGVRAVSLERQETVIA